MAATKAVIDFRDIDARMKLTGTRTPGRISNNGAIVGRPLMEPANKELGLTDQEKKRIRSRARRKQNYVDADLEMLYDGYPISEWDAEELARGRPRDKSGGFRGPAPKWINRAVHEQIVKRFEEIVREDMNTHTVSALKIIGSLLGNEEEDEKGKPKVSAGTKLDAAKFLIEHVVGKPKQRMETDISVKLQGILGHAMVNPAISGSDRYALTQGYVEVKAWEDDDDLNQE